MKENAVLEYPPHADPIDRGLFDTARRLSPEITLDQIMRDHGIDVATAWWHDSVCDPNFASQFEATDIESPRIPPTIVLIRGAFYQQHHHTGADGQRIIQLAEDLGWPVEVVPIKSFGSLETNARIIIEHLSHTKASRVILVSLSKGSADIAMAMADPHAASVMERVCGWVSLSGITTGTPLVKWLRSHRLRTIGVHLLLWSRGQRFAVVDQLCRYTGPLVGQLGIPPHIRAIHVVGCPTRRHLRHPWANRGYDRIAPLGPTDGGGILLSDLSKLPGMVYPVWGADHYLQPDWDVLPLIRNILLHAAQSAKSPSTIPANRSTA